MIDLQTEARRGVSEGGRLSHSHRKPPSPIPPLLKASSRPPAVPTPQRQTHAPSPARLPDMGDGVPHSVDLLHLLVPRMVHLAAQDLLVSSGIVIR